jgi:hypothetical protein
MLHRPLSIALFSAALWSVSAVPLLAQAPPTAPTTQVLTALTVRPSVDRAQLMSVMPNEVRATVKLYLDGKIQQWYSRSDGRGVIFILNCASAAEAKALMDQLPLAKADLATFEYTPLSPLTPLRMLIADPPAPSKQHP